MVRKSNVRLKSLMRQCHYAGHKFLLPLFLYVHCSILTCIKPIESFRKIFQGVIKKLKILLFTISMKRDNTKFSAVRVEIWPMKIVIFIQ
jgi:hypothetical protein